MEIQISTDKHVAVDGRFRDHIGDVVVAALARVAHTVTRVEVHFRDESPHRAVGDHVRCLVQVRPTGMESLTAQAHAGTSAEAFAEAVDRLEDRLHRTSERLTDTSRRAAARALAR